MTAAILLAALSLTGSCQETHTETQFTGPVTVLGRTFTVNIRRVTTNVVCPAGWNKTSGIRSELE